MSYIRHMEYRKQETDVHPQTGESMNHTTVDVYIYPDNVTVWGWGWSNTFRPGEKPLGEIIDMVEGFFTADNFRKIYDDCPAKERYADARAELGDMESAGSHYLDYIETNITTRIDFPRLARSYTSGDQAYAKGILNLLHQAAEKVYGITDFTAPHRPYRGIVLPGVAQYTRQDSFCLAVCALDLDKNGACLLSHHLTRDGLEPIFDRGGIKYDFTVPAPCKQRGQLGASAARLLSDFHSHTVVLPEPPGEKHAHADMLATDEGWDR